MDLMVLRQGNKRKIQVKEVAPINPRMDDLVDKRGVVVRRMVESRIPPALTDPVGGRWFRHEIFSGGGCSFEQCD